MAAITQLAAKLQHLAQFADGRGRPEDVAEAEKEAQDLLRLAISELGGGATGGGSGGGHQIY